MIKKTSLSLIEGIKWILMIIVGFLMLLPILIDLLNSFLKGANHENL
jgi:hypothetical protein